MFGSEKFQIIKTICQIISKILFLVVVKYSERGVRLSTIIWSLWALIHSCWGHCILSSSALVNSSLLIIVFFHHQQGRIDFNNQSFPSWIRGHITFHNITLHSCGAHYIPIQNLTFLWCTLHFNTKLYILVGDITPVAEELFLVSLTCVVKPSIGIRYNFYYISCFYRIYKLGGKNKKLL